jgi:glycosyltransferase involved in cell wall biosynthesis
VSSLSIVVLAYDEEQNVGAVLEELFTWLDDNEPDAEVIIVDDGSKDHTAERAEAALGSRAGAVVRHPANRGMGAGLKTGVRHATGEWVTFLPADGQIAPEAIGRLRAAAADEDADVVLSVYEDRDDGLHRKVLSAGVRGLILLFHGVRIRSDGPYLFRRRLFVPEELAPDSFFLNFEFPIRAKASGLSTRTVTIRCRPRRAGQSKTAALRKVVTVGRELVDMRRRSTRRWLGRMVGR